MRLHREKSEKSYKGPCVPVKLFKFPAKLSRKSASVKQASLQNHNFLSQQNICKGLRSSLSENKLSRSSSYKSNSDKNTTFKSSNCSFIDLEMDQFKEPKLNTSILSSMEKYTRQIKNQGKSLGFSISIDSFYKSPGVYTPAALIKKPIIVKKSTNFLDNPMRDWIVFNTVSLAKPLNKVFITRSTKKLKLIDDTKPKIKLQAWIPQPVAYCKSPITGNSELD